MAISTHSKFEYKKNDRLIFEQNNADVAGWRKHHANHAEEFRKMNLLVSQLNHNVNVCEQRFNLLKKLNKTEDLLLSDLKNLLITKETHLNQALFQVREKLSAYLNKKTSSKDLLVQYDTCLQIVNNHLIHTHQLKTTIKNYQQLLLELKEYLRDEDVDIYQTHILPLENSIKNQNDHLNKLLVTLSAQHNTIIDQKATPDQLLSYNVFLETGRDVYDAQSFIFYPLASEITQSRPKVMAQDIAPLSELKKLSFLFNTELKNYINHSDNIYLDQKFDQFNRHITLLEKNLTDLKDENMDDAYQIIFDRLQKAIKEQLAHEHTLLNVANSYFDKLIQHKYLGPEIAENAKILENSILIIKEKIEFLTTTSEKLIIGKNQRSLTSLQDTENKVTRWTRKIPRQIKKLDDLEIQLKERNLHLNMMGKELNKLHQSTSLMKFPVFKDLQEQIHSLLQAMNKYKKALQDLEKKVRIEAEHFNSNFKECKSKMNFLDKTNNFQKIFGAFAKEYESILKAALHLEDKINAFATFISDSHKVSKNLFNKESTICEQLKQKINDDKKHFAKCYQTFTIEKSEDFQKEHNKIMRVNCLLQNIYENLTVIEKELNKIHCDSSGITLFKTQFASILINNTVHEEDLEKTLRKYMDWIHFIEHTDAISSHSKEFSQAIQILRSDFKKVRNELVSWRISSASYTISTTMRLVSPAVFAMLAIVIPGGKLLPNTLANNGVVSEKIQKATEKIVTLGSKEALKKAANTLSPTERKIGFDDLCVENNVKNKETTVSLAGIPGVKNHSKDDCKLSFDLSYLWRETLHVKIHKAIFNKSMVLTGVSSSISLALGLTGAGTPLAIGLIIAGTAVGTISITAYDEYQQCIEEAKIRFQSEERLKKIEDTIRSLEIIPERHIFNKYYAHTMNFIQHFITHLRVEKDDLNVNDTLLQMMDYLAKILNILPSDIHPSTTMSEGNIKVKSQNVDSLLHFLKMEAEDKENLRGSINYLNSHAATMDAKTTEKTILTAREHIVTLENIFKTLHEDCDIPKSPFHKSLDLLHESEKLSYHDGFFKPKNTYHSKIKKTLVILVGEDYLGHTKDSSRATINVRS